MPEQLVTTGQQPKFLGWNNTNGVNPLFFRTNAITRMRLNGEETHNYLGSGYMLDVKGHFGIGLNNYFAGKTPLTMLHLEGPNNTIFDGGQLRTWMKTGMFARENSDFMYVGMKPVGTNRSDAAVSWGDDVFSPEGPDNLLFLFNTTQNSLPGAINPLVGNSANGYEMMRMTACGPLNENNFQAGYIGVGPLFSDVNRPQNRMHINAESALATFVQISNAPSPTLPGTGRVGTDGLKLGIQNFTGTTGNRVYGYLQWQEHTPFIVQTASSGAGSSAATGERLRITSIGALNNTEGGFGGLTAPANRTRIAISADGATPLTRPKSLLQIGYDYGNGLVGLEGYRKWMDLGVLASNNKDHVWIGLKPRDSIESYVTATNDKLDAVVAWGTDRLATSPTMVDNMRFIFTGHPFDANPEVAPSTSFNGLEMMRMYPASVYTHPIYNASGTLIGNQKSYGRVGIGDFTLQGVNEEPTQKLDVVGNGRFRYLPDSVYFADTTVTKIVMVDPSGVLRWKSFVPSEFGTNCPDTVNGKLNADKKVVLNDYSLYFTNRPGPMNLNENRLGLGYLCGTVLPGKLAVRQLHHQTVSVNTIAGHFYNSDTANVVNRRFIGALGRADGKQTPGLRSWNIGGSFSSESADINVGVLAEARAGFMSTSNNQGGNFTAANGGVSTGLVAQGSTGTNRSIGVSGVGTSPTTPSLFENIGGQFTGAYCTSINYGVKSVATGGNSAIGVYGTASGGIVNRAGFFAGDVEATGFIITPSDQQFKTSVSSLNGSLQKISALRPVSFFMDNVNYPQFKFDSEQQFGFIAQELETVLPNLVHHSEFPAQYDSLGNETTPSVTYKSVNYNGLIPLNTKAIIELNQKLDKATLSDQSIKTNVQDLTGSLDKVLDMRGVSYDWNHTVHPELNLDSVNHVGFIAQEIQQIDSRLTYIADDSLLHVEYDKVVPILAEAIEELNGQVESKDSIINAQSAQITDLNNRLTQLENCLSGILPYLCQLSNSAIQANTPAAQEEVRKNLTVTLNNRNAIVLDQNVPNPFAEQTIINFSIPETVQKAQIHFYDANGRFMNSVEVTERGLGSITVFGSDLSTGVYTYTLVADGQVVATKKMMKQ
jgi:hypothetical protein